MTTTDSCAGGCCAVFPLHVTNAFGAGPDLLFILSMLVPLTQGEATERYARLGYGELPLYPADQYDLFTCRHWDEDTRLCTAYDRRPAMCRDYPYEARACERGCGYALDQQQSDAIADRKQSVFRFDIDAQGWRVRTQGDWSWDADAGLLKKAAE